MNFIQNIPFSEKGDQNVNASLVPKTKVPKLDGCNLNLKRIQTTGEDGQGSRLLYM